MSYKEAKKQLIKEISQYSEIIVESRIIGKSTQQPCTRSKERNKTYRKNEKYTRVIIWGSVREAHLAYISCNQLQPSVELSYEIHKVLDRGQLETPLNEDNTPQPGIRPGHGRKLLQQKLCDPVMSTDKEERDFFTLCCSLQCYDAFIKTPCCLPSEGGNRGSGQDSKGLVCNRFIKFY